MNVYKSHIYSYNSPSKQCELKQWEDDSNLNVVVARVNNCILSFLSEYILSYIVKKCLRNSIPIQILCEYFRSYFIIVVKAHFKWANFKIKKKVTSGSKHACKYGANGMKAIKVALLATNIFIKALISYEAIVRVDELESKEEK